VVGSVTDAAPATGPGWVRPNREQRRAGGFVRERKVYKLTFRDHELEGLVVRARSVPLGVFLDLMELASSAGLDTIEELDWSNLPEGAADAIRRLLEEFGRALVEWNLEDENGPVPATFEGLAGQDLDLAMEIIEAWMTAIAGVAGPLGQSSPDGKPSLAGSLPMEPLSESPAS
jgi:hypothetical protein